MLQNGKKIKAGYGAIAFGDQVSKTDSKISVLIPEIAR